MCGVSRYIETPILGLLQAELIPKYYSADSVLLKRYRRKNDVHEQCPTEVETSTQSRHRESSTNQVRVSTAVDCAVGESFVEAGHHDRLSPFPVRTLTSMSAHSTRPVFVVLLVIAPHLAPKPAYSLTYFHRQISYGAQEGISYTHPIQCKYTLTTNLCF